MSIKIKKHSKETSQSLVRRFSRRIQQSGILRRARKNRFFNPAKSKTLKKKAALRREELKKDYEKKVKMGEIKVRQGYGPFAR